MDLRCLGLLGEVQIGHRGVELEDITNGGRLLERKRLETLEVLVAAVVLAVEAPLRRKAEGETAHRPLLPAQHAVEVRIPAGPVGGNCRHFSAPSRAKRAKLVLEAK